MPYFNFDLTQPELQIALSLVVLMCALAAFAGWRNRASR